MSRYTDNGTVFFKQRGEVTAWAVQINKVIGAGSPFTTVKWASWANEYMPYGLQETNEPMDMLGWEQASDADIILYATPEIHGKLETIKTLVRLGYKGKHATDELKMADIEWKMSQ